MLERVVSIAVGVAMVAWVLDAAVRNFMLPRASKVRLSQWVGRSVGRVFTAIASPRRSYHFRDRVLALRPVATLLTLQAVWLFLVYAGFVLILWGVHEEVSWNDAMRESGSGLFTLGFATPDGVPLFLVYAEALIGLTLMALLISYLPTIYAAFQKREFMVAKLAVRSGFGRAPWRSIGVSHLTGTLGSIDQTFWTEWENWFVELSESHTSLAIVSYYRSPDPENHWISAARQVLDMASLRIAVVDVPLEGVGPHIAIRSGTIALRQLARSFGIPFDPDPQPDDPISLTRAQFDEACDDMADVGVPLVADRDAAWRAFAGWRVNYDAIIEQLAAGFLAPPSPWTTLGATLPAAPTRELILGGEDDSPL